MLTLISALLGAAIGYLVRDAAARRERQAVRAVVAVERARAGRALIGVSDRALLTGLLMGAI